MTPSAFPMTRPDALPGRRVSRSIAQFDAAMAQQKAAARAAWKGSGEKASDEIWFDLAANGSTEFTGYTLDRGRRRVIAIVKDGQPVETAEAGDTVVVLTSRTPHLGAAAEMGDAGTILRPLEGAKANVEDTGEPLGRLHIRRSWRRAG